VENLNNIVIMISPIEQGDGVNWIDHKLRRVHVPTPKGFVNVKERSGDGSNR
jgi:hypothetical protein